MSKQLLLAAVVLVLCSGVVLGVTQTDWDYLYYGLFYNNPPSNNTQTWTVAGEPYTWVPQFNSSTVCTIPDYLRHDTWLSSPNATYNVIISDEYSEAMIAAAMGADDDIFHGFVNTYEELTGQLIGNPGFLANESSIICWKGYRNGTTITCKDDDSASDGTARIGLAFYIAANNLNFTVANRSYYRTVADSLASDHVAFESIAYAFNSSVTGVNGSRLPMGGVKCAYSGIGCSTDMWIGYAQDLIRFMIAAYNSTSNATFLQVAKDYANAFVTVSLQNDTDGDGFGVAPFNFNWVLSGGNLTHASGGGVNTYHYNPANAQWDDSDAPRFLQFCDVLQAFNKSGANLTVEPLASVVDYCEAWSNTVNVGADTTCLQYYYNGTCSSTIRDGYYENGLGYFQRTWFNQSTAEAVANETYTHFSTSTYTYDSTTCMGIYRGVRPVKAIGSYLGLEYDIYGSNEAPAEPEEPATPGEGDACYQEQADEATTCGGLSTGSYYVSPASAYFYINYTIPFGAVYGTEWRIKAGSAGDAYYTIPSSCLTAYDNNLVLRIESITVQNSGTSDVAWGSGSGQCYNGTGWEEVTTWNTVNARRTSNGLACSTSMYNSDYNDAYPCTYFDLDSSDGWYQCSPGTDSTNGCYDAAVYEEGMNWLLNATITLNFYDDETLELVTGLSVTGSMNSNTTTYNFTTSTGSTSLTNITPGEYLITYSATGYYQREINLDLTTNTNNKTYNLYLSNSTTQDLILANVKDKFGQAITGARISAYRKELSNNNYYLIEECDTDQEGRCLLHLELYDTYYRFNITYNDATVLSTADQKIISTTLTFYISLTTDELTDYFSSTTITGAITYSNTTGLMTTTVYNNLGANQEVCLEISTRKGSNSNAIGSNCTTTTPGTNTITYYINTTQLSGAHEIIGRATLTYENMERVLENYVISQNPIADGMGLLGLFMFGFIILGVIMFSGLWNPVVAIVMGLVGLVLFQLLGLINIGLTILGGVGVIAVAILFLIKR